jgi:hypothetical protein
MKYFDFMIFLFYDFMKFFNFLILIKFDFMKLGILRYQEINYRFQNRMNNNRFSYLKITRLLRVVGRVL